MARMLWLTNGMFGGPCFPWLEHHTDETKDMVSISLPATLFHSVS